MSTFIAEGTRGFGGFLGGQSFDWPVSRWQFSAFSSPHFQEGDPDRYRTQLPNPEDTVGVRNQ